MDPMRWEQGSHTKSAHTVGKTSNCFLFKFNPAAKTYVDRFCTIAAPDGYNKSDSNHLMNKYFILFRA